jgi:flagellar motor switch protein FliN
MNKDNNPTNADDNDFEDFDFDDDEEESEQPATPAAPASTSATAPQQPTSTPPAPSAPAPAPTSPSTPPTSASMRETEEPLISPSEIPMVLTIEIGRVQMTADYLFHLQQGNTLQLHTPLESGVWLCINGKRVGRGELVRVGDVVGVRVLELGHKGHSPKENN